jgi:hypothetical protein
MNKESENYDGQNGTELKKLVFILNIWNKRRSWDDSVFSIHRFTESWTGDNL